jgi:SAM-dependent methyltransferase
MGNIKDTENTYGLLWNSRSVDIPAEKWHFNAMQSVVSEPIVRGALGIEVGSGCGYDSYAMAKENPKIRLISIDISDGIFKTRERTKSLGNVFHVKCSALDLPVKDSMCDFAYSFGVLHHTPDPKKGLSEIARVLKNGSTAYLYLYEDHSENILKFIAVKIVSLVRMITTRIPHRILYALAWLASPFVYIAFTLPCKILKRFGSTSSIAANMPFNFGSGLFSLQGDLYDRLGAPVEFRFSRQAVIDMFTECGFLNIKITRLRDTAGWVVWGQKR